MPGEDDITLGEVARMVVRLESSMSQAMSDFKKDTRDDLHTLGDRMTAMQRDLVSNDRYTSDQAGNDARHIRAEARIKGLEETQIDADKFRRDRVAQWAVSIGAVVVAALIGFLKLGTGVGG